MSWQIPEDRREAAWHALAQRQLADRAAVTALWQRYLPLRLDIAANAGLPDYRAYAWQQRLRFDYTPDDCRAFHAAIEAVIPVEGRHDVEVFLPVWTPGSYLVREYARRNFKVPTTHLRDSNPCCRNSLALNSCRPPGPLKCSWWKKRNSLSSFAVRGHHWVDA